MTTGALVHGFKAHWVWAQKHSRWGWGLTVRAPGFGRICPPSEERGTSNQSVPFGLEHHIFEPASKKHVLYQDQGFAKSWSLSCGRFERVLWKMPTLSLRITFTFQLDFTKFHLLVSSCIDGRFRWAKNNLKMFGTNIKTRTRVHKPIYLIQDLNNCIVLCY